MKKLQTFLNGLLFENPTLVIFLGMCPALGTTNTVENATYMSLCVLFVLLLSNIIISLIRKIVPNEVRIPVYIIIIATLVTIVDMLFHAYLPDKVYSSLGSFISLIVVNCIILGRAESYASKNNAVLSIFDGLGMGFGFTIGLTLIGLIREILGAGTAFDIQIFGEWFTPITIFIMAPGAFLVLAFLVAGMNIIRKRMEAKGTPLAEPAGCLAGDCTHCGAACPGAGAAKMAEKEGGNA